MFKSILVPLDGSKLAEKALPYAEALAEKFEAELILVQVLQLIPEIIGGPHGGMVFYEQSVQDRQIATDYLNSIMKRLRELHQLPVRTVLLEDRAVADAIINLASQTSINLIVMSTHGRSGLSRWVFGSVANKILSHAPCPIFLIRVTESD